MKPEIEATFLNINKDELRAKLKQLGGKLIQEEKLMRRVIFDMGPHAFVRVRDEGNKITITYKQVDELSLSGSKEINLEVNDYESAIQLLKVCGLEPKAYQETLREEWELDGVELDIDTWPWLPTYVEIEGPSEPEVKSVAAKLGFNMTDAHYGSVDEVYKLYYNVTNEDINTCPQIRFTDPPSWLKPRVEVKN